MNTNIGIALVVAGALFLLGSKFLPFGHLPGDLEYHSQRLHVMLPLTTCIMLSIMVSIVLRLLGR